MQEFINRLWIRASTLEREEGQAMTEYAVILTLIAVALVVALTGLRNNIVSVINAAAGAI